MADLGTATVKTDTTIIPGQNPNTMKASGRKNYRPKRTNAKDEGSKVLGTTLADPSPKVDVKVGEIRQDAAKAVAGSVTLDLDSPARLISPFVEAGKGMSREFDRPQLEQASDMMFPAVYIACARQVYETLIDADKSELQGLKAAYYWKLRLPEQVGPVVSIFGNVQTKLGRFGVVDPVHTYIRLLEIARIHETNPAASTAQHESVENFIYDVPELDKLARKKIAAAYERFLSQSTTVTIGVSDVEVLPRARDEDEDIQAYCDYLEVIGIEPGVIDGVRWGMETTDLPRISFTHLRDTLDPDRRDYSKMLVPTNDINALRDWVIKFSRDFDTLYDGQLDRVFEMDEMPLTSHGGMASLVHYEGRSEMRADTILPLPDSDAYYGFCIYPAKEVTFDPEYELTAVDTNRAQTFARYAMASRKAGRP